jgi:urease gamma subunit
MFDAGVTALLRAVLEETCRNVPLHESAARTHVASSILEAARRGETSAASLKEAGQKALRNAPSFSDDIDATHQQSERRLEAGRQ